MRKLTYILYVDCIIFMVYAIVYLYQTEKELGSNIAELEKTVFAQQCPAGSRRDADHYNYILPFITYLHTTFSHCVAIRSMYI